MTVSTVLVLGQPFYGLCSQLKLLYLFNSRLTFFQVHCCDSVTQFRSLVTWTWLFAHALFFKAETINNLVPKFFFCCTKTCLSGIFFSSEDFGFCSTKKIFFFFFKLFFWLVYLFFFNFILCGVFFPLRGGTFKETEYLKCFWEESTISNVPRLMLIATCCYLTKLFNLRSYIFKSILFLTVFKGVPEPSLLC